MRPPVPSPASLYPAWPDGTASDPAHEKIRRVAASLRDLASGSSVRSLANRAEINHVVLNNLITGQTWPAAVTIAHLEAQLGTRLWPDYTRPDLPPQGGSAADVPAPVFSEMWPVVSDPATIKSGYDTFEIVSGVGESGPVTFRPAEFPHRVILGRCGAGKSVAAMNEVYQHLAAGHQVFICDSSGSTFSGFENLPGVTAIGTAAGDQYLAVLEIAKRMLDQRMKSPEPCGGWTPLVVVLDSIDDISISVRELTRSGTATQFHDEYIAPLIAADPSYRINTIQTSQVPHQRPLPHDSEVAGQRVQLVGVPPISTGGGNVSAQFRAFLSRHREAVAKFSSRMRFGLSSAYTAGDEGAPRIYRVSYVSPPSMSSYPEHPEFAENRRRLKSEVIDRLPKLYPRLWLQLPAGLGARERALIAPTVPVAVLDDPHTLEPDVEMAAFDPRHPQDDQVVHPPIPDL